MNKSSLLKGLNLIGVILSFALIGFVLYSSYQSIVQNSMDVLSFNLILLVGYTTVISLTANFALTANYSWILSAFHRISKLDTHIAIWIVYGKTQLFKYLPGNVFHYLGRQVQLGKLGIEQVTIGNASLVEIISQIGVAFAIAMLLGTDTINRLIRELDIGNWKLILITTALVLMLLAIVWLIYYLRTREIKIPLSRLVSIPVIHGIYFALSGLAFYCVTTVTNQGELNTIEAILIFSCAWIIGTVVPGASAGMGVREATILALGITILDTNLALAAILIRLVTTLADLALWAMCKSLDSPIGDSQNVKSP